MWKVNQFQLPLFHFMEEMLFRVKEILMSMSHDARFVIATIMGHVEENWLDVFYVDSLDIK